MKRSEMEVKLKKRREQNKIEEYREEKIREDIRRGEA